MLGQYVVQALVDGAGGRTRHQVTVLDRLAGPPLDGVRYLVGDVQDLGQVFEAVADAEVVVHLAAIPRPIVATADTVFRTNVLGTFNVHEAAFRLGIKRVVSTSSTAAVGWDWRERDFLPDYLPLDEEHPCRPQDPYGLSKELGEAIARSYTAKCDMETVVLRPPWVIPPSRLEELRRNGGREEVRFGVCSYIDTRDLAEAYYQAVERPLPGHTVLWVAADDSTIAEPLSEFLPRVMPALGDRASGLTGTRPAVSNARARELLGWRPRYSWRHAEGGS
jgi:nucleoside-diphosphate-sugar epimerase